MKRKIRLEWSGDTWRIGRKAGMSLAEQSRVLRGCVILMCAAKRDRWNIWMTELKMISKTMLCCEVPSGAGNEASWVPGDRKFGVGCRTSPIKPNAAFPRCQICWAQPTGAGGYQRLLQAVLHCTQTGSYWCSNLTALENTGRTPDLAALRSYIL